MNSLNGMHRAPAQPLPPGAADCHMHVFGPYDRYPLAAERAYNVPEAPLVAHERMKRAVGLERTVLVQASGHGNDNRALLEALAQLGLRGRAVAVVAPDLPMPEQQRLDAAGVRGIRLNMMTLRERYSGDPAQWLSSHAALAARLGWHLQLFCAPDTLLQMEPSLRNTPTDVVIDHMGFPEAALGIGQPVFQAVLRLLGSGRVWVKVSGADRVARASGNLRDAIPFIRALAEVAPERLVWGSDWPNIGFHTRSQVHDNAITRHRELDAGELLDVLAEAVPDTATRHAILAGNPERLYRFDRRQ